MLRNKILIIYLLVLCLVTGGLFAISYIARSPAEAIVGKWSEILWEYEKVPSSDAENGSYTVLRDEVKNITGQNLVIHKYESWLFTPDGKLKLFGPNGVTLFDWHIKGRGHVLELNNGYSKEYYHIMKMSDSSLVLNYETDLETRGIAKLTFIRSTSGK